MTLSLVHGSREPELWYKTIGEVINQQADHYGNKPAVIFPEQSVRLSFRYFAGRSVLLAKSLLGIGLAWGDCIGIMAGNRYEYIDVFLGASRIGCPVVVLNNNYTPEELSKAVTKTSCKLVFIASQIGSRSLGRHIELLSTKDTRASELEDLRHIVCLDNYDVTNNVIQVQSYESFTSDDVTNSESDLVLQRIEQRMLPSDVVNLQFTSGTTGAPKAATLTHTNIINNARFVGAALRLTPDDVVCCPPPLFHCGGLVMGFLASWIHGSSIIFPSGHFDAKRTVDAILAENATVSLGVPTMFLAELEVLETRKLRPRPIRTGIIAGSAVSPTLVEELRDKMGLQSLLIAYGMTETSPVTFMTSIDDPEEKRYSTLGKVMPHTSAKVIDANGRIVPRGQPGELCTSGYALQKGYWKDKAQTDEVMKIDENGVLWMHTGDEVRIDEDGYAYITGRIKDIIIRGGENISPMEIEERLLSHASINEACVVAIKDEKYGEVVGCFLVQARNSSRPNDEDVRQWVRQKLGRHKAPLHIFWTGDPGVGDSLPKTGTGKYQKHLLRDIGNRLVSHKPVKAQL